jgi:hypothetical protein
MRNPVVSIEMGLDQTILVLRDILKKYNEHKLFEDQLQNIAQKIQAEQGIVVDSPEKVKVDDYNDDNSNHSK